MRLKIYIYENEFKKNSVSLQRGGEDDYVS